MVSLRCKEIFCLIYSGLLFTSGILLIAFSVVLSYRVFYHFNFIPSGTIGPFIVIFILGFLHLFLTWLGIKGPTREHNFHIVMFMVFTLILLICEFAVGIWSMILWDEVSVEAIDLLTASFNEMLSFDKKEWNRLQRDLRCCGLHNNEDYSKRDSVPISCYDPELTNGTIHHIYSQGCQKPLVKYAKRILIDGAMIGFISGIFQAFGIFAFYTFFKSLRAERAERAARRQTLPRQPSAVENQAPAPGFRNVTSASTSSPPTTPPVTVTAA